mmetsp:Transcript_10222/g.19618  ORF Transcript_10222/g.19618 Transcript_10222/m.19618 type:complete len:171 (+) Transcript_10222:68-580(+)|eukprot:scaffold6781_cov204-Amphora_coffeaeformis.AAC.2
MGAPKLLNGSTFELICDHAKGHQSDFAPTFVRKRNAASIRSSPVPGPKKKLQLSRWDACSSNQKGGSINQMPVKPIKPSSFSDSPPSLKRLISPPPSSVASLQNVLKPVRRMSFEKKLDELCGVSSSTKMTTSDLLASVLNNLDLLDEETSDAMFEMNDATTANAMLPTF